MRLFTTLGALAALLIPYHVQAAAVFAHFMVGNVPTWGVNDWVSDMRIAQEAHIDAFVLNMASGWPQNDASVAQAFQAAQSVGFQLLFSFDYAGNGSWPINVVTRMINQYGGSSAYFHHQGKPLVSTFEGPGNADDWRTIKANTGCFFVPDWSSLGAGPASAAGGGVADGLFSWAAWPYGPQNMTTYVDASYRQALGSKPYMMGISPWFYTNLPGYDKNWLWNGDDLWYHRWQQVMTVQPEFLQIISWNDYGESHYIGPLDERQYGAFEVGNAPFNYVRGMPHDGWRAHLPFLIDTYKGGQPAIGTESLVVHYRNSPSAACTPGGTTGNTASQLQIEFEPADVLSDRVFFTALLESPAHLQVISDGNSLLYQLQPEDWEYTPDGGVGLYHASVPMAPMVGRSIHVRLYRPPTVASDIHIDLGMRISNSCAGIATNWNPYVDVGRGKSSSARQPTPIAFQVCTSGFAISQEGHFDELCRFTCAHGYCPLGACVCTNMGEQPTMPPETGQPGYPANGDANYGGLCSFACHFGFCPARACAGTPQPPFIPQFSPFSDPAPTAGQAAFDSKWTDLCRFTCAYGFCPMHRCQVLDFGYLNVPPPAAPAIKGEAPLGDDFGLCAFACGRGHCTSPCYNANLRIEGMVHFGDSYAAGMGTGKTSGNRCRVGSSNYGSLLRQRFLDRFPGQDFNYESRCCSGDKIEGLRGQIAAWNNKAAARVGTLTIGGNDVGFSDLVYDCVITPNLARQGSTNRARCVNAEQEARDKMSDTGVGGLRAQMADAFRSILNDARSDFHLFVTGYPLFFNAQTDTCRDSSFHYWWGGYGARPDARTVFLTTALREELDRLVLELNAVIQSAVGSLAEEYGGRVHYVEVSGAFDGHRWCEGRTEEPDPNNPNTWFFLSGWPDIDTPPEETEEIMAQITAGPLVLPNASNCNVTLGSQPDPYDRAMCLVSQAIRDDPQGLEAMRFAQANADIAARDVNSQNIPWYMPTRQIKTFHPRTPGMNAFATTIYNVIQSLPELSG